MEFARYVLAQHLTVPNEGTYDTPNQFWAGGMMATNDNLAQLSLTNVNLGAGKFSIQIVDTERYFNINLADDATLRTALEIVGVDATQTAEIVDSILDWRDTDDTTLLNGAESDYYLGLSPPYMPKNGPIDDLEELLRIKGITPEIYYGPAGAGGTNAIALPTNPTGPPGSRRPEQVIAVGLKDLFTTISAGWVNQNTASEPVKRLAGWDENSARSLTDYVKGPDGILGTEDDTPFRTPNEFASAPGIDPNAVRNAIRTSRANSATFQVTVYVDLNNKRRELVAILRRNSQTDVKVLMQYWK